MSAPLPIIELYKAIQSEGSQNGYPNILVRLTGCTHRCYFGQNNWCDTWYSSIHPEKGRYTWEEVLGFFEENRYITRLMLTGGSPTMHPELLQKLITAFQQIHQGRGLITLETEGSHFVATYPKIDLISLSPKLSNSVPPLGVATPLGKTVDAAFIRQHNKWRQNWTAMRKLLAYHKDYHLKIVVDAAHQEIAQEVEALCGRLSVPKEKVWLMPAGADRVVVQRNYAFLLSFCVEKGYNFSGRAHIIAFGDKRGV